VSNLDINEAQSQYNLLKVGTNSESTQYFYAD
jgi:hypothetical protein